MPRLVMQTSSNTIFLKNKASIIVYIIIIMKVCNSESADNIIFFLEKFIFKGTVSRKLRPMLLYIIRKLSL